MRQHVVVLLSNVTHAVVKAYTVTRTIQYTAKLQTVVYWGVYAVYQPPGFFDSVYSPQ